MKSFIMRVYTPVMCVSYTERGEEEDRKQKWWYDMTSSSLKEDCQPRKKKKSFPFPGRRPLISLSEIFSCDDTTFSFRCGTHAGSVLERIRFFDNWSCVTSRLVSGPRGDLCNLFFFYFWGELLLFSLRERFFAASFREKTRVCCCLFSATAT